jgi:hypothetical protein
VAATSPASRAGSAPTSAADELAAAAESFSEGVTAIVEQAGELASDLAQAVTRALGALVGGADGAPKPVKEMIEQVASVVGNLAQALGALLLDSGDGHPAPAGQLIERVAGVVGNLAQTVGEALGAPLALGGGEPPDLATNNPLAQPVAFLYERTTELFRGGGELVGQVVRAAQEALSGGLANQQQTGGEPVAPGEPSTPPAAPLPAVPPLAPGGGSAPVGYASSFLGASGSSSGAFELLFAVLILFSVTLLQGGKLSWLRREPLRPSSALRLAVERPG